MVELIECADFVGGNMKVNSFLGPYICSKIFVLLRATYKLKGEHNFFIR